MTSMDPSMIYEPVKQEKKKLAVKFWTENKKESRQSPTENL